MKPERVVFIDESLEKSFSELNEIDPLKKGLVRAIRDIQENVFCGRNVKKKLIPNDLIKKYSINNLWIYNSISDYLTFSRILHLTIRQFHF